MAVNPYLYAIITDGTDTFTLEDGTENHTASEGVIINWSPAVASLRTSALSGAGEYEDVIEEIEISVRGTTKQAVYDAFAKLKRLLDKADAWRRSNGQQGSAVLFKWCPSGAETSSIASPLQAPILARADGDSTGMTRLPSDIPRRGIKYELAGVVLRFLRRGQWLHTSATATHNSVTNGDLATLTFAASQNVSSPTKIDITNFYTALDSSSMRGGYVAVSEISNGINIVNAELMTTGGNYSSTADSSNYARNTNVLRYTPPNTSENFSSGTLFAPASSSNSFIVFANAKTSNNSSSFLVRAKLTSDLTANYTNYVTITSTKRDWYCLGTVSVSARSGNIALSIGTTAASTSYTLDVDTVVIVSADVGNSKIIGLGDDFSLSSLTGTLSIDHRALTKPSPIVTFTYSSVDHAYSFEDSPYISTSATTIYAVLLSGGTDYWRQVNGGAATTNNWTATRTAAYVSPV